MKKLIIGLLLATAGVAHADNNLTFSGFATVTAGKAYSGYDGEFMGNQCPCFIGNYEHGAVYNSREWDMSKESLVGAQVKYQFNDQLSGTVQAVSRASEHGQAKVDWAYLSYDVTPDTTIQVGRRRLPIYAYSDSVYIGYTLPWVRVPQDIYGWEVGAYNGVNVRHTRSIGDWAVSGTLFAGQEISKDNVEMRKIYYGTRVDDSWKDIRGGIVDLSNDIFSARVMYMENKIDMTVYAPSEDLSQYGTRQRIIGLSATLDYENFLVRAEANRFIRPTLDYRSSSWTTTVGYKVGKFTPLVGYSSYKEKVTEMYTDAQIDNTTFAAVRWDFRKNMDLKLQWDSVKESSTYDFSHDSKMVTLTFDMLF